MDALDLRWGEKPPFFDDFPKETMRYIRPDLASK
jgi:hypothetical protein